MMVFSRLVRSQSYLRWLIKTHRPLQKGEGFEVLKLLDSAKSTKQITSFFPSVIVQLNRILRVKRIDYKRLLKQGVTFKSSCELNFTEMIWGYTKAALRKRCKYSFEDLKLNLPLQLESVPIAFIRRASRHCYRFMSGYRRGFEGPILDYCVKQYKSHRAIPMCISNAELTSKYGEQCNNFKIKTQVFSLKKSKVKYNEFKKVHCRKSHNCRLLIRPTVYNKK